MKETPRVPYTRHHSKDRPEDLVFVGNTTTGRSFYACGNSGFIYMTLMDDGVSHWRRWRCSEGLRILEHASPRFEINTPEELCMVHKAMALLKKEIYNV